MADQTESPTGQSPSHSDDRNGQKLARITKARGYQLEMFEESMQRNIIVAMDTGSGKTHVAVMRIAAELERLPLGKFVWFMAPTVALCDQQYAVLQVQLPVHQIRFLSGDFFDRWSDQREWDAVLENIRIVVSTHQVLLDALTHGFVSMDRLGLMVFDEAHHCIKNHAANRIMRDFYHPLVSKGFGGNAPHILGLTASPIIRKVDGLQIIESNLNAISRTPKWHREDLLRRVHHPILVELFYNPVSSQEELLICGSPSLQSLLDVFRSLDIKNDPYVLSLRSSMDPRDHATLDDILVTRKTSSQKQIKLLVDRSINIYRELGGWAADLYISACIKRFRKSVIANKDLQISFTGEEKAYLFQVLDKVFLLPDGQALQESSIYISSKVRCLLRFLVSEAGPNFSGILFAEQRATVAILSQLIALHPDTKKLFNCGAFVGLATSTKRKGSIADLAEIKDQWDHLDDFRGHAKNLIVATSVLEEGIDVPGCKLVICFDRIPNVKSFIQRRGRARQPNSKLAILLQSNNSSSIEFFYDVEREMRMAYEDEQRVLKVTQQQEDEDETSDQTYQIEATGALLTFDNAKSHLHHFCNTLSSDPYVDRTPQFFMEENSAKNIRARVLLPLSIEASLRNFLGRDWWKTEKAAKKDAAFEAYVALHKAGLVNDNLLPLKQPKKDDVANVDERPAVLSVNERLNPWIEVALQSTICNHWIGSEISLGMADQPSLNMLIWLPHQLPSRIRFELQWNDVISFWIQMETKITQPPRHSSSSNLQSLFEANYLLFNSVFRSRIEHDRLDFPAIFTPDLSLNDIVIWARSCSGSLHASVALAKHTELETIGLVRYRTRGGSAHILQHMKALDDCPLWKGIDSKEDMQFDGPYLEVSRLTKRKDFLHKNIQSSSVANRNLPAACKYIPISHCEIDNLPFKYSQFALFIPSIMHQCGNYFLAQRVCDEILSTVGFKDLNLVVAALCSSSAREAMNYQRLEFLGDSILKFSVSLQLMDDHSNWHEGYLSAEKDRLVSNRRLSKAAVLTGLDKYISTKAFTGRKWRPSYISDLLQWNAPEKRKMSSKVLADVVEALVGAAFIDGGYKGALNCLKKFLPEVRWLPSGQRKSSINDRVPSDKRIPPYFAELETLVGYRFEKKTLLLEAMTHASFQGDASAMSYQRLEFLGDAVLESLVVSRLFRIEPQLSEHNMHLMKIAVVNADFLAFLCMEWSIDQDRVELLFEPDTGETKTVHAKVQHEFWKFMRHSSSELAKAQFSAIRRHGELREQLKDAFVNGHTYPWALLARLRADKFFSDIVESLLGAVFLDSSDSDVACQQIAERIGILPYLRRLASGQVHVLHPKEELGQLVSSRKLTYNVGTEENEGNTTFWCLVLADQEEICRVSDGVSRIEVETRAAETAVKLVLQGKFFTGYTD